MRSYEGIYVKLDFRGGEEYDDIYLNLKLVLSNEKYSSNKCRQEFYDVH